MAKKKKTNKRGRPPTNGETADKRFTMAVSERWLKMVNREAKAQGVSVSEFIRRAVEEKAGS